MKPQFILCCTLFAIAALFCNNNAQAQLQDLRDARDSRRGNRLDSRFDTRQNSRIDTRRDSRFDDDDNDEDHEQDHRTNRTSSSHRDSYPSGSRYVVPGYRSSRSSYYYRDNTYYYNSGSFNSRPQRVTYGSFSHVEQLASRLEALANDFCLEIDLNYSRNPGFEETYREAYEVLETAKYIHEEAIHGHHDEIAKEVRDLDSLFHHVEDDVEDWRSKRGRHHDHGHGRGSDMHNLLEQMESIIHHLMNDVGVKVRVPGVRVEDNEAPRPRPN